MITNMDRMTNSVHQCDIGVYNVISPVKEIRKSLVKQSVLRTAHQVVDTVTKSSMSRRIVMYES